MPISRRAFGGTIGAGLAALALPATGRAANGTATIAYAGSMGVLMDKGIGPVFRAQTGDAFHGIGRGAFGLAHLLAAKTLQADAFVSITRGPIEILQKAGLVDHAVPVASTAMVLAWSPRSRFRKDFEAQDAAARWYEVLEQPGLRFGRTDPRVDPQGRNVLFTFDLAERLYKKPDLMRRVLGKPVNPAQIFPEPSLLSRIDSGAVDATIGYESAIKSLKLPFLSLPKQINLSDPSMVADWYAKAAITLTVKGKAETLHTEPLVFYACVPLNAPNPTAGKAFVSLLQSSKGQDLFARYGYNPPLGGTV